MFGAAAKGGSAKGFFPGRLKRQNIRKRSKFKKVEKARRWKEIIGICSQIQRNLKKFDKIFPDVPKEDFLGFSSEECGLQAYRRVNSTSQEDVPDILKTIDFDKNSVTTRLSHRHSSRDSDCLSQQISDSEDEFEVNRASTPVFSHKNPSNVFRKARIQVEDCLKPSPIKPARFIAPSRSLTTVASNGPPTFLNIKKGAGHPEALAKALLSRANKRRTNKTAAVPIPANTSQFSNSSSDSSFKKTVVHKKFILPHKSSRSSRIIKANRKYLNEDTVHDRSASIEHSDESLHTSKALTNTTTRDVSSDGDSFSYSKNSSSRPLLKEPTFRMAGLDSINNKKQLPRAKVSSSMRSRKLIKRARFKHPTSSSQLILGSDSGNEEDKKKQLIKEATFKLPSASQTQPNSENDTVNSLSLLGLHPDHWKVIRDRDPMRPNDPEPAVPPPLWDVQEIHNVLHGCHTFGPSWSKVARHYEYHVLHKDSSSIKQKAITLQRSGLLSESFKVKSSILIQIKPKYSADHNVIVKQQQQIKNRSPKKSFLPKVPSRDLSSDEEPCDSIFGTKLEDVNTPLVWKGENRTFGIDKEKFRKATLSQSGTPNWLAYELHNLVHGVHFLGVGKWVSVLKMYKYHPNRNQNDIRCRIRLLMRHKIIPNPDKIPNKILSRLQPKLSKFGREYFREKILRSKNRKERRTKPREKENKKGSPSPKRAKLQSPRVKHAYHLFGTAPVWEDGNSSPVMDILENKSPVKEKEKPKVKKTVTPNKNKKQVKPKPVEKSVEKVVPSPGGVVEKEKNNKKEPMKKSGPRIKHVCRRASLVTGLKKATTEDHVPHLTALPKVERERIAKEAQKEDTATSSDSDSDMVVTPNIKFHSKRSPPRTEEPLPTKKRKTEKVPEVQDDSCGECKACLTPDCHKCVPCIRAYKEEKSSKGVCIARPMCEKLMEKKTKKEGGGKPSRNLTKFIEDSNEKPVQPVRRAILSPDSKYRMIQTIQENSLPLIKVDNWKDRYEINSIWDSGGAALITSMTPFTRWLCFLCGSAGVGKTPSCGDREPAPLFIFCNSCCAPFHPFCLDDQENEDAIDEAKKGIWICKRCHYCRYCGHTGNLLECRTCRKTYHSECLPENYPSKPSAENQVWVCMKCVRCKSCGSSRPGQHPGASWTHDFQFCERCGDLFDRGNFCPVCRKCYRDEDFDTRMVQCGKCRRWVHSRCENLTVENYTLLSHMPDSVRYVCPDCDGRRAKAEQECDINGTSSDEDPANASMDGDRIRTMLMKIHPEPPWRKALVAELQCGLEKVTMALFHSKMSAAVLKGGGKSEHHDDNTVDRPHDLFAIRFEVHNKRYTSVAQFSTDVSNIIKTVDDDSETDSADEGAGPWRRKRKTGSLRETFHNEMRSVFPWFNVGTGRVRDCSDVPDHLMRSQNLDLLPNATLPPNRDHEYAQWQDRDIVTWSGGPDTPIKSPWGDMAIDNEFGGLAWSSASPNKQLEDLRQCLFCSKYGDDISNGAGRMLYCGQDDWVHVNCALWSAEVFEQNDGSLQNVHSAISRGRMMKCEGCKLPGATVGCNTRDCPKNFHFMCARKAHCVFLYNKKVFCMKHKHLADSQILRDDTFGVMRRVVVDNDDMRPNKKWQRGIPSDSITVLVGSVVVHRLGKLSLSSDNREFLIPINYRITRCFWSAKHAGKRTIYTITVTEAKPSRKDTESNLPQDGSAVQKINESHHTISHAEELTKSVIRSPKRLINPTISSCKRNLMEKISQENRKEQRPKTNKGTYSIITGLNASLPKAITPLPTMSTPAILKSPPKPVFQNEIQHISPANPFVNTKLLPNEDIIKTPSAHTKTVMNICTESTSSSTTISTSSNNTDTRTTSTTIASGNSGSVVLPSTYTTSKVNSTTHTASAPTICDTNRNHTVTNNKTQTPSLLQNAKLAEDLQNLQKKKTKSPSKTEAPLFWQKSSTGEVVNKKLKDLTYKPKLPASPTWRKIPGSSNYVKPTTRQRKPMTPMSAAAKETVKTVVKSPPKQPKTPEAVKTNDAVDDEKVHVHETRLRRTRKLSENQKDGKVVTTAIVNGDNHDFKCPQTIIQTTRVRSLSHDSTVNTTSTLAIISKDLLNETLNVLQQPPIENKISPSKTKETNARKTRSSSAEDDPNRRYPRRNSFTCLKSFSGLSPNYAIASYQPLQEKQQQNKRHARKNKKINEVKQKSIKHITDIKHIHSTLQPRICLRRSETINKKLLNDLKCSVNDQSSNKKHENEQKEESEQNHDDKSKSSPEKKTKSDNCDEVKSLKEVKENSTQETDAAVEEKRVKIIEETQNTCKDDNSAKHDTTQDTKVDIATEKLTKSSESSGTDISNEKQNSGTNISGVDAEQHGDVENSITNMSCVDADQHGDVENSVTKKTCVDAEQQSLSHVVKKQDTKTDMSNNEQNTITTNNCESNPTFDEEKSFDSSEDSKIEDSDENSTEKSTVKRINMKAFAKQATSVKPKPTTNNLSPEKSPLEDSIELARGGEDEAPNYSMDVQKMKLTTPPPKQNLLLSPITLVSSQNFATGKVSQPKSSALTKSLITSASTSSVITSHASSSTSSPIAHQLMKQKNRHQKIRTNIPGNVTNVSPSTSSVASMSIKTPPQQMYSPHNRSVLTPQSLNKLSTSSSSAIVKVDKSNETEKQSATLDKMIEFYTNKNKLSEWECVIVRSYMKAQMQNQKFSSSPLSTFSTKPTKNKSLQPTKKKHRKSTETKTKRTKNDSAVDEELLRQQQRTMQRRAADVKMKWDDVPADSPLLYIYKNAVLEKNQQSAECREMLQSLNRKGVTVHVPWATNPLRKMNKLKKLPSTNRPHLIYHITSDDGYEAKGHDLNELICELLDSVQKCRENSPLPCPVMCFDAVMDTHDFLGTSHDAIRFLVEQLPGARHCSRYQAKYHRQREVPEELVTHVNPHGCARCEKYRGRSKPDMFSFLASRHRLPPQYDPSKSHDSEMMQRSTRRATSMELPMAMRFRHLKTFSSECVGVYRSLIHGRGLYCKRDIDAGEMIMEYTGQVIRSILTDIREQRYESKGIGCYMFRMDDNYVIDATLLGSAARFINHSCDPNCFSRIVSIEGKKHIVIFALRKIYRGEELTYDYKFPIEDDDQKISCNCGAKTCRQYMN